MVGVRAEHLTERADILLHQSGHIMLSDFDLAKQSDSVARPTAITRPASDPNGVSGILSFGERELSRQLN